MLYSLQKELQEDARSVKLSWVGNGVLFDVSTDNGKTWESVENGKITRLKNPGRKIVVKALLPIDSNTFLDNYILEINPAGYSLFTGKVLEESTGLVYFGARWYDPEIGRFISVDPAEDGENWYAYCNNNSINRIDLDGKFSFLLPLLGFCVGGSFSNPSGDFSEYLECGFTGFCFFYAAGEMYDVYRFYRWLNSPIISSSNEKGNYRPGNAFHALIDPTENKQNVQSVINGINPKYFNKECRFGRGFYVSRTPLTASKEIEFWKKSPPTHVIRYRINLSNQRVLDLTKPSVANRWGFSKGVSREFCQQIGESARAMGYDAIIYPSFRGSAANIVIFNNFEDILKPMMVRPGTM